MKQVYVNRSPKEPSDSQNTRTITSARRVVETLDLFKWDKR
jgi:hypothetical protein